MHIIFLGNSLCPIPSRQKHTVHPNTLTINVNQNLPPEGDARPHRLPSYLDEAALLPGEPGARRLHQLVVHHDRPGELEGRRRRRQGLRSDVAAGLGAAAVLLDDHGLHGLGQLGQVSELGEARGTPASGEEGHEVVTRAPVTGARHDGQGVQRGCLRIGRYREYYEELLV